MCVVYQPVSARYDDMNWSMKTKYKYYSDYDSNMLSKV